MKVICAWCKKIIQDGPEFPVSHGICEKCAQQLTGGEDDPPLPGDSGPPPSDDFCDQIAWWIKCMVTASFFLNLALLAAALAAEFLHALTGGRFPRLIDW